jgi:hypothetical protein
MNGKGVFLWQLKNCAGGNMVELARRLNDLGFSWVAAKAADGFLVMNESYLPGLVDALKAYNIKVWGWQYVYGARTDTGAPMPEREFAAAKQQMDKYHFEGWIVDAEGEYKRPGSSAWAEVYMGSLRNAFPDLPIALCSYRFPVVHKEFPWSTFLKYATLHMPQVYWIKATNPDVQLSTSYTQLQSLKQLPFVPVGSAFEESGWRPTVGQLDLFDDKAHKMNLPGVAWWAWDDNGLEKFPEFAEAIGSHEWLSPLDALAKRVAQLEDKLEAQRMSIEALKIVDEAIRQGINLLAERLNILEDWARGIGLK